MRVFLSAEWRDLVMVNYEVDPKLLNDYVPPGTALDSYDGRTYVSLVGFQFRRTKLFGALPVPFHRDFDEINLRFYVRHKEGNEDRRGVVFIAEIVPKWAIAKVARIVYGENYVRLPMKHRIDTTGTTVTAEYEWQQRGAWSKIYVHASGNPAPAADGSLEQFITEHYWGYSKQRNSGSLEYRVSHVPWNVWRSTAAGFEGDATSLYGFELGRVLQRPPDSAFIADGSLVSVLTGKKIQ
jgi:uncharacterized protein YqjF (DUF2071 family)